MIIVDPASVDVIKEMPDPDDIVIVDVKGERDNPIYTYRIPVKIDLRNALRLNISDFSISVLNKPFSEIASSGFLNISDEGKEPLRPSSVNNKINKFSENAMIRAFNNERESIVSKFNVDFKEVLDKQIMSRFEHLTDEELFGNQEIVVVADSDLDDSDVGDLTTPLPDPDLNLGKTTFKSAVDALYQQGGDPASAFEPMQDELSYTQSEQGLIPSYVNSSKRDESHFRNLKSAVRTTFTSEIDNNDSEGTDVAASSKSLSSTRLKTFKINKSLRIQEVNFYVDVESKTISDAGGYVHLAINCFNLFGLIIDIRDVSLQHSSFSNDLSIFVPKLKVEAMRTGVNKDIIVLTVFNESMAPVNANVYYKVTSECGSLDEMRFQMSQNISLEPKSQKRIKYTRLDIEGTPGGPMTGGSVLFRVTPEILSYEDGIFKSISNTYFARVKSPYLERNFFVPVIAYNRSNHVEVELHNIPKNVESIQIVKRNLTLRQRNFATVKNEIGSAYPNTVIRGQINSLSLEDYDVKNEHTYEYKALISYSSGESMTSINSAIHEFLPLDDNITMVPGPVSNGSIPGVGQVKYFDIAVNKSITPADKLFDQISSYAKEPKDVDVAGVANPAFSLFQGFLDQISATILEAVLVRVVRFDTVTGEYLNVSEFNVAFNKSSSTEGSVRIIDTNNCAPGRDYVYIIKPFMRSVYELLVSIQSKLKEFASQSSLPGRNIVNQLMRTVNRGIESSTGSKFYSRMCYTQGTIQSEAQSVEQVNGDLWLYGRNGNISYVYYNHPDEDLSIQSARVSLIKAVSGLAETYQTRLVRKPILNLPRRTVLPSNRRTSLPGSQLIIPTRAKKVKRFRKVTKAVKKEVADAFLENIVKIEFEIDGNPDHIDYFVITAFKNRQTRIVGALHCPDSQKINYTFIDDTQVGYQGAINYQLYAVKENKDILGPFKIGAAVLGSGV